MIDFNRAIELIRRNGGFKSNSNDSSYYRTYTIEGNRPLQARISNHGTWLWTWYDKQYDPSYAINTCVVYSENGEDNSNIEVDMRIVDKDGNVIGEKKPFEVTQYVYNCQLLDENDSILINQAVQNIWQNKGYKDPLANTPKHARVMILRPNEEPEIITENKTRYNMNKKLIRLTESDLHKIVKESVNRVLNESTIFDRKIPEVIEFLEELERRLESGLLTVNGFEGGNRMFAMSSLRECVSYLKKMNGNLVATNAQIQI